MHSDRELVRFSLIRMKADCVGCANVVREECYSMLRIIRDESLFTVQ